jgi:hypothetical protein
MKKEFKMLPPMMPNFLPYEVGAKPRQEGFNPDRIPVSALTEQEAIEYGELMKQTFIEHWRNKSRPQPPEPPQDRIYVGLKQVTPKPPKV